MHPREYIEKALDLQFGSEEEKASAVLLYQQAIQACDPDTDGFDYLYAHYELMRMHADTDTGKASAYAEKCLEILRPTIRSGAIMHFTEQGQFHEEVIRYATNSIAWHTCLQTNDAQKLEEVLQLLELGESYVDAPEHAYLLDTKARILLKLNRKEEAYEITRACLINDPYVTHFDDILDDKEYKQWKEKFEKGIHVVFSEEEILFLKKAKNILLHVQSQLATEQGHRAHFSPYIPDKEVISKEQAVEKYGLPDYFPHDSAYVLFKGDLRVQGPLTMQWVFSQADELSKRQNIYGMIVDGDLTVNGDILDDNYLYLFVRGNLQCDYFFSYNATQIIRGDAVIRLGIYGEYNDGQLDVYGKLHTPYLISNDHAMPDRAEGDFIHLSAGDQNSRYDIAVGRQINPEWSWQWDYFDDSHKLFSPDFWTEQDRFSVEKFFELVRTGRNPFAEPGDTEKQ